MTLHHIVASAPGKLALAGEYAVLEPGEPSIALSIDRRLIAKVAPASSWSFSAESLGMKDQPAQVEDGKWVLQAGPSPRALFATAALNTSLRFLTEIGETLRPFALSLEGTLESPEGLKYGFGSSAAVCVAIVGAVLSAYGIRPDALQVFKLAAIAHRVSQGNGSSMDIAASAYGGAIRYVAHDPLWLKERLDAGEPLPILLDEAWPRLGIEPLPWPRSLVLGVGWTGKPATTKHLVDAVSKVAGDRSPAYARFLIESRAAVNKLAAGFRDEDPIESIEALHAARRALAVLQEASGVGIETPLLAQLADAAEVAGGAGKSSGAGGGDCGVGFFRTDADLRRAETLWREAGVEPLEVTPVAQGLQILRA